MSTDFHGEAMAMAQWENRALIDLRVAGSNPAGQLLIYFRNVLPVLTKTLCRHASLVPRSRIKAFVTNRGVALPGIRPSPLFQGDQFLQTSMVSCFYKLITKDL